MNAGAHHIEIVNPRDHGVRELTLLDALRTVSEAKWLIAGIVLLAILGGICHVLVARPTYRADALLNVEDKAFGVGALADFDDLSDLFGELETSAQAKILRSRSVLGKVVNRLNLDIVAGPEQSPLLGLGSALTGIKMLGEGIANRWFEWKTRPWFNYGWGNGYIKVQRFDTTKALLGQTFTLIANGNSRYRLFLDGQLILQGSAGKLAEVQLPNHEHLNLLIADLRARPGARFEVMKEPYLAAIKQLSEALTIEVQGEEGTSEDEQSSGLMALSLDGPDPDQVSAVLREIVKVYIRQNMQHTFANADTTLKLLKEQVAALKKHMHTTEAALSNYRLEQGSVNMKLQTEGLLKRIVGIETRLSDMRRERADLLQRYMPGHEQVKALDVQIATLNEQLSGLEQQVNALPKTQQDILSLTRTARLDRHFYTLVSNKIQELTVARAGTIGNVYVYDNAATPDESIKPQKALVISVYTLLGGVLGLLAAFARRALRGVVEDPGEIRKQMGLPVYAVVPHSRGQKKCAKAGGRRGVKRTVLAVRDSQDVAIESLRSLRSWMSYALTDAMSNVLLLTGPGPEVGKSFVTVNLGAIWARAGKRVLVVDADLRRSRLHRYFGVKRGGGLSDVVVGALDITRAIRPTKIDGLSILTSGGVTSTPSELLMQDALAPVLEDVSSRFDYVLIDSPPILAVSDAAILGRLAAAALLVVKANTHTMREIEQSIQRLRQGGVPLRGAVFNDMDTSRRYGYGKYYGYDYGYSHAGR